MFPSLSKQNTKSQSRIRYYHRSIQRTPTFRNYKKLNTSRITKSALDPYIQAITLPDSPPPVETQNRKFSRILRQAKLRVCDKSKTESIKNPEQQKLLDQWQSKIFKKKWGDNLGAAMYEQERMIRLKAELKKKKLPEFTSAMKLLELSNKMI